MLDQLANQIAVELCDTHHEVIGCVGDVVVIIDHSNVQRIEVHSLEHWKHLRENLVSTADMLDSYAEYRTKAHGQDLAEGVLKALAYRGISKERADALTAVHPEACHCDECAGLRFAYCGEE